MHRFGLASESLAQRAYVLARYLLGLAQMARVDLGGEAQCVEGLRSVCCEGRNIGEHERLAVRTQGGREHVRELRVPAKVREDTSMFGLCPACVCCLPDPGRKRAVREPEIFAAM